MQRFFEDFEIEYIPGLDAHYHAAERMMAEEKDAILCFEHLGLFIIGCEDENSAFDATFI